MDHDDEFYHRYHEHRKKNALVQRHREIYSKQEELLKPVVQIFALIVKKSRMIPFKAENTNFVFSSGFFVRYCNGDNEETYIMTNGHAVANAVIMKYHIYKDEDLYDTNVLIVNHNIDLAVISTGNLKSFSEVSPIKICKSKVCEFAKIQTNVQAIGFPDGDTNICALNGMICRQQCVQYRHSKREGFATHFDCLIREGSSGGPVFAVDGSTPESTETSGDDDEESRELVGVAFEGAANKPGLNFFIPFYFGYSLVESYVKLKGKMGKDVPCDKIVVDFLYLGFDYQCLDGDMIRKLGLDDETAGILVTQTHKLSEEKNDKALQPGDIVTHLAGSAVTNNGVVHLNTVALPIESIGMFNGTKEKLDLKILRKTRDEYEDMDLKEFKLIKRQNIVPELMHDQVPSYACIQGLVFTSLSKPLIEEFAVERNPNLMSLFGSIERMKDAFYDEVVVMTVKMNDPFSSRQFSGSTVKSVDDIEVKNVLHLLYLVVTSENKDVKLVFDRGRHLYIDSFEDDQILPDVFFQQTVEKECCKKKANDDWCFGVKKNEIIAECGKCNTAFVVREETDKPGTFHFEKTHTRLQFAGPSMFLLRHLASDMPMLYY